MKNWDIGSCLFVGLFVIAGLLILGLVGSCAVKTAEGYPVQGVIVGKYPLNYSGSWASEAALLRSDSFIGVIKIDRDLFLLLEQGKCYRIKRSFLSQTYDHAEPCE